MRESIYGLFGFFLEFLAQVAILLALIPVLYPITLPLILGIILISGAVLFFRLPESGVGGIKIPFFHSLARTELREIHKNRALNRRALRSIKMCLYAGGLNLVLFFALSVHSWACYINPLSRELEPLKRPFLEMNQNQNSDTLMLEKIPR